MARRLTAAVLATLALTASGCRLSTPTDCGRLSQDECTDAVRVAQALLPSDFHANRIVVEYGCGPGEFCKGGWNVFVVFEPNEGNDLAFFVDRNDERVEAIAYPAENLPPHIVAMLGSN